MRLAFLPLLFIASLLSFPVLGQDYYWVGGSGNWSDTGHWATSSGGNTFHAEPPGDGDDVFFDANSFTGPGQAVTIDIDEATCRDMTWSGATGTPVLTGTAGRRLRIFGELTFIPAMSLEFAGEVRFESTPMSAFIRIITSAGHVFPGDIYIDGDDGQWALADAFATEQTLYMERGTLGTGNFPITCQRFVSNNSRSRRLNLGRSVFTLRRTDADSVRWLTQVDNFNLEARSATIEFADPGYMFHSGNGFIEYQTVSFQQDGVMDNDNFVDMRIDTVRFQRNGSLLNDMTLLNLQLSRGFEYRFASDRTFIIRELLAEGGCEGYVSLRSTIPGEEALFRSAFDFTNNYLILQDIHNAGTTTFLADNSIDLGNNDGWTINSPVPRTLYWVNDGGGWYESVHWSLSSGGPGGECPPTPLDDVIFDANSFSSPNQVVMGEEGPQYYCHNMTWNGATGNPELGLATLQLFGSLELQPNMVYGMPLLQLRSNEEGETLTFNDNTLQNIRAEGTGSWAFQDALAADTLLFVRGTLISNGADVQLQRFHAFGRGPKKVLNISNSEIIILGDGGDDPAWFVEEANMDVNAAASLIFMDHADAHFYTDALGLSVAYGEVLFPNSNGTAQLSAPSNGISYERVQFAGDGIIRGSNDFGTLQFAPGGAYQLEAGATQTIQTRWEMPGNPCGILSLSSTNAGTQTIVRSSNATIDALYVEMRDQRAEGGADFDAGLGSRNLGNNSGWTFPDGGNTSTEGLLGKDRVLCDGASITLDPELSDQGQTYSWSTGATTPAITVDQPDDYIVQINFPGNCEISDTVTLFDQSILAADFGADTTLCTGESLLLDATSTAPEVSYQWSNGSSARNLTVTQSGTYSVTVSADGCEETESILVEFVDAPQVELGPDQEVCEGETVTLDATVTGADAYQWNTGATTPSIQVTQSGLYRVQANIGRCARRDSVNVTFKPVPTVDLGPDQELCEGETLTLDATNAGATYSWNTSASSATLEITQSGSYSVDVDLNGCVASDEIQVTFKPLPQIDLGPGLEACAGETLTLDGSSANGADTYSWSNGATTPTIQVTQSGTYRLEATLDGCTATDEVQVTFKPLPTVDLGPDRELCEGETLTLDATNSGATYSWNTGATSATLEVTQSGTYSVDVDLNGCVASDEIQVTFKPAPQIDLGPDREACEGETLTLDGSSANGADSYSWSNGATTPTIQVTQSGTYRLEATLDGCTATDEVQVTFKPLPTVDLGPDQELCEGETLTLDATNTGATYSWNTGATSATLEVTQSGTYSVDVDLNGCVVSDEIQVTFKPLPQIDLGPDLEACEGETLTLDGSSANGADSYSWSNGATTPTIQVTQSGTYRLEATLDGCTATDEVQVTFKPLPTVDLGPDQELCEGETLTLDATNTGATYSWNTGATSATLEVTQSGTYSVDVDLNGCVVSDEMQVTFKPLPQIDLGPDLEACEGETLTLDGSSANGADSYSWSNGATTPSIQVSQSGNYRLEATLAGCTATDEVQVTFKPLPTVELGPDRELCEGETLTLDATNTGATYNWSTGATSATLEVTQSGTYSVDVDLNGCVVSDQIQVSFKPLPEIDLGPDRRPCEGEVVELDGSSTNGADAYQWNTGANSATIQVTQSGTYRVDVTLDGCTRRESVEVNYIILPEEVLGADVQSCEGETVTLDALVPYGDAVYQWNTGATSPRLDVTQSGSYSVDIQVAQCRTSDEVSVTFNPVPDFELGGDAFLCEGETYDLFIPVTGDSYRWSDGSTKDELTVTYPGGLIWGEVTLDGCTYRDSVRIDYQDAPQVNLGADTAICAERPLRLNAGSVGGALLWSTGSTQRSIQVATAGTYWLEVQDGVCTVRDSIQINIRDCVFLETYIPNAFSPDNDGINDTFRPFLPAGIQINSYRFAVFDRWGNQVFETTNPDDSWDGTARGQQLPQGVFVYFLELDFVDDDGPDEIIESGDVMLIK